METVEITVTEQDLEELHDTCVYTMVDDSSRFMVKLKLVMG